MVLNNFNNSTLGSFSPGDRLEITGFRLEDSYGAELQQFLHRLAEVGFLVGERVELLNQAPYSRDPISVRVKEATYALRREDANLIYATKIEKEDQK